MGAGVGWYVSTRPDAAGLAAILTRVYVDAGLTPAGLPAGLETVTRHGSDADYVVLVNHSDAALAAPVAGTDLLTGAATGHETVVAAGGVAVVRTPPTRGGGR